MKPTIQTLRFQNAFSALVCLAIVCWSLPLQATTFTSSQNGLWSASTTWGGAGVPASGDSITLNHIVETTDTRSFGDNSGVGAVPSEMDANNATFYMNGVSSSLTHIAGSTLIKKSGRDTRVTGTGTFTNDGRFELEQAAGGFGLLLYSGSPTFVNNNEFVFTQSGAWLQLGHGGGDTPVFQNNGTVEVNVPTNGYAAIKPGSAASSLGQFLTTSQITLTSGALVFAAPNVTNMDNTTFNSLFSPTVGSINSNSEVRLAGEYENINLTAAGIGAANLARVSLGHDGGFAQSLTAHANGTLINVPEADGGIPINNILTNGTPTLNVPTGRTMTNAVGSLIKGGTNNRLIGNGEFINNGKLTLASQVSNYSFLMYNGSPTFTNSATGNVILNENDARIQLGLGATDGAVFNNNGNLEIAMTNPAHIGFIGPAGANVPLGQYNATQPINFTQGTLIFSAQNQSSYTDSSFNNLFGAINNNSELRLGGEVQTIHLTAAGIGAANLARVSLASSGSTGHTLIAHASGTSIHVPEADGGILFNNITSVGTPTIDIPTGRTMTNEVGSLIVGGRNNRIWGAGEFINKGKFELLAQTSGFGLLLYNSSPTFTNQGEFLFSENTAELRIGNGGGDSATFTNAAGGIFRADMPSGTHTSVVEQAGSGTFNNDGIVEVLSGTLRFDSNVTLPEVTSPSTLDGGEWRVISTGNAATLDLRPGGTSAGSITTIGSDAKVVMSATGGTASFLQLGSISTLQGELYVHDQYVQAVGASPMNVTGTLGGDGTYNAVDSIVFSGGELDPAALDGTAGTMTINGDLILDGTTLSFALGAPDVVGSGLNDLVIVDGALTLDGTLDVLKLPGFEEGTYRLFEYDPADGLTLGNVTIASPYWALDVSTLGQVNLIVSAIPEPTTFWLLTLGMAGLVQRKRRLRKA